MKKNKASLRVFSYFFACLFLLFSTLISCSHFYEVFLQTAGKTFTTRMTQYATNTGKTAPVTFTDFLTQLQQMSSYFKKISLLLVVLLLLISSGLILLALKKRKGFWLEKMDKTKDFRDLSKEIVLKILPVFIFTLLLASGFLLLSESGLLKFLQNQFNHYLPHYIPKNLTVFFKTYNSQTSILLPFSSENFFTLNTYLSGTKYSLFPTFLLSYLLATVWSFSLFIGGLYHFKRKYFKQ